MPLLELGWGHLGATPALVTLSSPTLLEEQSAPAGARVLRCQQIEVSASRARPRMAHPEGASPALAGKARAPEAPHFPFGAATARTVRLGLLVSKSSIL